MTDDNNANQLLPLDQMLSDVLAELKPFWDFQCLTQKRVNILARKPLSRGYWILLSGLLASKDRNRDVLSGQTTEMMKRLLEMVTPSEERAALPYVVASGDYTIHEIGNRLVDRFPDLPFAALAKLHGIRRARLAFNFTEYLGVVLAAGSVVVKTIPKSVVEAWLGEGMYESFERWVFYGTAGVIGYLLLILIPAWLSVRKDQRKHKFIGDILEYAALAHDSKR